jgi:hypothetical protein
VENGKSNDQTDQLKNMTNVRTVITFDRNKCQIFPVDAAMSLSSKKLPSLRETLFTLAALRNTTSASFRLPFAKSHLGDSGISL